MAGKQQIDYGDPDAFLTRLDRIGPGKLAIEIGCSRGAVNAHAQKLRAQRGPAPDRPGVIEHEDGTASLIGADSNSPWTEEGLMLFYGFDPADWEIVRARPNVWGNPAAPHHQLRLDLIPRKLLIAVPDPSEWTPPPKPKGAKNGAKPRTIVIAGDHHCPHHDRTLHSLFLQWLADEKPDEGVLLGDLLDFSTISRHREREGFAQPVNEGLAAGFGVLMDYRDASPDTRWTMLRGNHDDRLQHQILDNVRGLHHIAAAGDDIPALSLRRLLHLDDLNITLIDEDWDRAKVKITGRFTARHGYSSAKNSTERMLSALAHSTVQGHTHRLSLRYRTEHDDEDEDEPTATRLAAEAGCMAEIQDGLGYSNDPDWQQGALLVHAWPDDDFHVAPLVYVPGRLLTPGKRYTA